MYNNKRSKNAELRRKQKQIVKKYVWDTSFKDRVIKEITETVTPLKIEQHLQASFTVDEPQMYFCSNEGWQDGLVLVSALTYQIHENMVMLPSDPSFNRIVIG